MTSAWSQGSNVDQYQQRNRDERGPVVAFFDVDGTLTYRNPDERPTNVPRRRVEDAVRGFVARGGVAVLSTGRNMTGLAGPLARMPFRGHVTMDGTYVLLDGRVVLDQLFPVPLVERVVHEMERVGMSALFAGESCYVAFGDFDAGDLDIPRCRSIDELREIDPGLRFGKIDFLDTQIPALRRSGFLSRELTCYDAGGGSCELALPGASKGRGAAALLDALTEKEGVAPSRVFAFGDSENDVSLLDIADVAVVMGQATASVRAHADYVTGTAERDGVVTALDHFGLV